MSVWSFGFGQALQYQSADTDHTPQLAGRRHSLSDGAPSSEVYNSSHRERRKKKQDYEAASDEKDTVLNGDSAESRGSTFCTRDNLLNSIAYINQELELLGLPCLKFENGKCAADMYFYINRLHDLLTLYHKTNSAKEDLETRNHRLSCETNRHQSTFARLRREQGQLEREMAQEQEKTRQVNLKVKQLAGKLKAEREEVKRLTAVVQSRDVQHKHDNKKKEREVISLKERLHQLLADKVPDRKVGMNLMNVLSSGEGRRATWKTSKGKQEEEMYQLLISNYEERHREMMLENADLRDCLLSLQRELGGLLKRTGNIAALPAAELRSAHSASDEHTENTSDLSRLSAANLDEGYVQMPFDIVRKEIESTFKATCDQITDGVRNSLLRNMAKSSASPTVRKSVASSSSEKESADKKPSTVDPTEIERLKKQISNYKDIIQQQEELIQQSLHSHSQSVETTFLHESQLLQEKENLSEQKKLFFEEKSAFERERRAFTDAAIRLGKERQALQEERSSLIQQHLRQHLSPARENQQLKTKGEQPSRLLPATPVLSPGSGATTPSKPSNAQDLYRALSLSPGSTAQSDTARHLDSSNLLEDTPSRTAKTFQNHPAIHFTPSTAAASPGPPKSVSLGPRKSVPPGPPKAAATGGGEKSSATLMSGLAKSPEGHDSSNFDAAASLESIRASLLRIRRSASQQEP